MDRAGIPQRYFLYWSGDGFQYVNYLCVLSLIRTNAVERVTVCHESAPRDTRYWDRLSSLPRVELTPVDWRRLARSCDVDEGAMQRLLSLAAVNHRSDVFRYLAICGQGGVYLDFDCLVLKDLSPLLEAEFFVGLQARGEPLNGAILGGRRGTRVLRALIEEAFEVVARRERLHWSALGPSLLTDVIARESLLVRGFLKLARRDRESLRSWGKAPVGRMLHHFQSAWLKTYPTEYFYPFSFEEWKRIFEGSALAKDCYVVHLWGRMSNEYTRSVDEEYVRTQDNLYANEARRITGCGAVERARDLDEFVSGARSGSWLT